LMIAFVLAGCVIRKGENGCFLPDVHKHHRVPIASTRC
jgi:hypothetical protein